MKIFRKHQTNRNNPRTIRSVLSGLMAVSLAILYVGPVFAQTASGPDYDNVTMQSLYGNWSQYVPSSGKRCGAAGGGSADLTVGVSFFLGTDPVERRVNLMKTLMTDFGLSPEQAAGIVGNFMWESGGPDLPPDVNETAPKKGPPNFSGGYGWAQWTGPRQVAMIKMATQNGYMANEDVSATDAANYAYLKDELSKGYAKTIDALKATISPESAALAFEDSFEHALPATANLPTRQGNARQAFNEYNKGGTSGVTPPSTGGQAGACAGGAGAGGSAACGDAVSCAKAILAKGAAGGFVIRPGAEQNLQTIAAGQQLTVCPGSVLINVTLMQLLLTLSNTYMINIHNFSAPGHSCDQAFHPKGRATDVHLEGIAADCGSLGSHPQNRAFAQSVMDALPAGGGLGQKQCIGQLNGTAGKRYFDDGAAHFHIDVGDKP
jgi:hypothetical protein